MRHELLYGAETSHVSKLRFYVALGSLIWWVIVWSVCGIGFTQLYATNYVIARGCEHLQAMNSRAQIPILLEKTANGSMYHVYKRRRCAPCHCHSTCLWP